MFLKQSDKVSQIVCVFKAFSTHFFKQNRNERILTAQENLLLEGRLGVTEGVGVSHITF